VIDFRTYAAQAKWAFIINQGEAAALMQIPGCPYPIGTPEYEAFCWGHSVTTDAIKGK